MSFCTFSIKNVIKNKWSSNCPKFKNTQLQFQNPGSCKKNKVYCMSVTDLPTNLRTITTNQWIESSAVAIAWIIIIHHSGLEIQSTNQSITYHHADPVPQSTTLHHILNGIIRSNQKMGKLAKNPSLSHELRRGLPTATRR